MTEIVNAFLSGAIALGFLILGVCFNRFWRRSRVPLFNFFSISFFLMAAERIVLVLLNPKNEFEPYLYLLRLSAFAMILAAIIHQNRPADGQKRGKTGDS